MKLETASYNSAGSTHNALVEETAFISYTLEHSFNEPALAVIELADPTGSIAQKYNVDTNAVYVGAGRAVIEDPTASQIFNGRIIKAQHNIAAGRVTLLCQDWLSQLDEDRINYDMREVLDGSELRESQLHTDADNATYIGPVYTDTVPAPDEYFMYDDDMSWADNLFNGKFVVFTSGMAGKITIGTGAYNITDDAAVGGANREQTWVDDNQGYLCTDGVGDFVIQCYFRLLGNEGNFAVSADPTAARVHVSYYLTAPGVEVEVQVVDNHDVLSYYTIGELTSTTQTSMQHATFDVPTDILDTIIDSTGATTGDGRVRFNVTRNGVAAALKIFYVWYEIDIDTTQDSGAYEIQDCDSYEAMKLEVDTDLTLSNADMGLWESCPYSIIDYIKNHLNGLVTASDPLFTLDTSIEATTGLTTRNYQERTTLEILKDLAEMDKAVFWIPLRDATPTFRWKKTFAAAATEMTDADVLSWAGGEYDYVPMRNEYHIYGVRIKDNQLYLNTGDLGTDPGADSKTKYGVTRGAVIKSAGTVSKYECEELGKALVERDEDVHLFLRATIAGLSIGLYGLSAEINLNSTILGLTDAKYVTTHWSYNSATSRTSIRMHPRQSIGFIKHRMYGEHIKHIIDTLKLNEADKNIPSLSTQEWA